MSLLETLKLPPRPAQAGQAGAPASATAGRAAPKGNPALLSLAAIEWRKIHVHADQRIEALKTAIKAHYAGRPPKLLAEIEGGVAKLDAVLDKVDQQLADAMADAATARDEGVRKSHLKNAKSLLLKDAAYIKTDPLIAHMDHNPFGVEMNLKGLLAAGLVKAAKALG